MRFFSKIGIEWGTYFSKKVPNFEIVWPTPATPRALTVKGVYVVSHSCYEQLYEPVCSLCTGFSTTKCQMYFVNFNPLKCDKKHFFDNFMYKAFAQFILHTFWCILMHSDAFWALRKKIAIFNQKNEIFQIEISCSKH